MKFEIVNDLIKGIPFISTKEAKILYDFILQNPIDEVLELGFAHGASSCYIAAALQEKGHGKLITIDLHAAMDRQPNILYLLKKTDLASYVNPIFTETSYNWELMGLIEKQSIKGTCVPSFDFCYLDGAHTWETDGFAFFLVDKLLKFGGWILFDDIDWSLELSPSLSKTDWVLKLPAFQRSTHQVEKIFDLLVTQHTSYKNLRKEERWGWAQKKSLEDYNRDSTKKYPDSITEESK